VSCRLWSDEDAQPYVESICDGRGTSFTRYDDSCYGWRLLRDAAHRAPAGTPGATGWTARTAA
jgi:hypothetical protein